MPTKDPAVSAERIRATLAYMIAQARARWMVDIPALADRLQTHLLNALPASPPVHWWSFPPELAHPRAWHSTGPAHAHVRLFDQPQVGSCLLLDGRLPRLNTVLVLLILPPPPTGASASATHPINNAEKPSFGMALRCTPSELELYLELFNPPPSDASAGPGQPSPLTPSQAYLSLRDRLEGQHLPMPDWSLIASGQGIAMTCPCEQVEELVAAGLTLLDFWLQLPPVKTDTGSGGKPALSLPPGTLRTYAGPIYLPPLADLLAALGPQFDASLTEALHTPSYNPQPPL